LQEAVRGWAQAARPRERLVVIIIRVLFSMSIGASMLFLRPLIRLL
jgi:hypothetical protein